jgi:hypothetical protein
VVGLTPQKIFKPLWRDTFFLLAERLFRVKIEVVSFSCFHFRL